MRCSNLNKLILVILALSLFFPGCKSKAEPKKPADFFPMSKGSFWKYEGKGNEYASFSREIVFVDNKRAQIREDNGGTVVAMIFEATDNAVIRVFSRAEAYGNENYLDQQSTESITLLQSPIEVGSKWDMPEGTRQITDTKATVKTPAGKFTECLVITTYAGASTITEYYKAGIGLVKREFKSGDMSVTSSLKKYVIKEDTE